jgi:hypothetical protein
LLLTLEITMAYPPGKFPCPFALAAALLALAGSAHAGHPLASDDTGTQGSGHWQLEANTDHARVRDAGTTRREDMANAALTYGATKNLDVSINVPWLSTGASGAPREHGIGDTTVLAKWRFFDGANGWSLGLRPEATLPSGSQSKGLDNGRPTAALTLISTYASGPWTWLANAGLAYNDNKAGERKQLWAASAAMLFNANDHWTLAANVGANRAPSAGGGAERFGLLGAIYHVSAAADIDLGWRHDLGPDTAADTLGAGLALRW